MKLQELQNLRNIVKQDNQREALLILLEELIKLREENNRLNRQIQKMSKKMIEHDEYYRIKCNELTRRENRLAIRADQVVRDEERIINVLKGGIYGINPYDIHTTTGGLTYGTKK